MYCQKLIIMEIFLGQKYFWKNICRRNVDYSPNNNSHSNILIMNTLYKGYFKKYFKTRRHLPIVSPWIIDEKVNSFVLGDLHDKYVDLIHSTFENNLRIRNETNSICEGGLWVSFLLTLF